MESFQETTTTTNIHQNQVYNQNKQRKKTKTKMSLHNIDETTTKLSTIESELLNFNKFGLYHEEIVKPRLILQSNEKKRFKLRYRPIEIGDHQKTYTFSIVDNPHTTYHIEVNGIATIPRLDMNPNIIFEKVKIRKENFYHLQKKRQIAFKGWLNSFLAGQKFLHVF